MPPKSCQDLNSFTKEESFIGNKDIYIYFFCIFRFDIMVDVLGLKYRCHVSALFKVIISTYKNRKFRSHSEKRIDVKYFNIKLYIYRFITLCIMDDIKGTKI